MTRAYSNTVQALLLLVVLASNRVGRATWTVLLHVLTYLVLTYMNRQTDQRIPCLPTYLTLEMRHGRDDYSQPAVSTCVQVRTILGGAISHAPPPCAFESFRLTPPSLAKTTMPCLMPQDDDCLGKSNHWPSSCFCQDSMRAKHCIIRHLDAYGSFSHLLSPLATYPTYCEALQHRNPPWLYLPIYLPTPSLPISRSAGTCNVPGIVFGLNTRWVPASCAPSNTIGYLDATYKLPQRRPPAADQSPRYKHHIKHWMLRAPP